jgi:hypothetical protein
VEGVEFDLAAQLLLRDDGFDQKQEDNKIRVKIGQNNVV